MFSLPQFRRLFGFLFLLCLPSLHAQTTGSFTNAGLTLHYTIEGKGTPVVLLSGGPGMDAAYMQPVANILARDAKPHTAIVLSQRGTTGSMPATLDATTITPALYLSDLEALRIALGYKQWVVLGHSAGSITAMQYAIAHPDRVAALVLLGAVPPVSTGLGRMMDNATPRLPPDAMQKMAALENDKSLSPEAAALRKTTSSSPSTSTTAQPPRSSSPPKRPAPSTPQPPIYSRRPPLLLT